MRTTNTRQFQPLDLETRSAVDTETAAFHLNRRPQTLRAWASTGSGPLSPVRVHGRLAWPVDRIRIVQKGGRAP
jgi:hypothetical protein